MTTSFTTGMRRRQNLRVVLFVIILATLPFYCAGIFLWGTAPQTTGQRTPTGSATVRATVTPLPTRTPGGFATLPGGFPTSGPLPNTPGNFFPPPIQPTFVFPPTVVFPATSTPAPTLTPPIIPPTATQPPAATATTIPIIDTPIPDTDGDGVPDNFDPCPNDPWPGSGCPPPPTADPGITPSDTPLPISP